MSPDFVIMKTRILIISTLLVASHCKPEPPSGYNYPQPTYYPNLPEVIANNAVNPCAACQLSSKLTSNSGQFQIPSRNYGVPMLREQPNVAPSFSSHSLPPPSRSYGIPVLPEPPALKQSAYTEGSSSGYVKTSSSAQFNAPSRQYFTQNVGTNAAQSNLQPNRQYLTPNIGGDLQSSVQSNFPSYVNAPQENLPQTIQKHIYVHVAPPDQEEQRFQLQSQALARQKHYKIIFIKTPSYSAPQYSSAALQQVQNEEKTLVYVLVKKPDAPEDLVLPTVAPTQPSKPEVYFIKYKAKNEPIIPAQIQNPQVDDSDSVVVDAPKSVQTSASANANSDSFRTYGAPNSEVKESSGPY